MPDRTLRSAEEIERRLAKNVTPVIGSVKLADLHRRDMNRVVDPVLKRERRVEAGRVFEDLRAVVRWAVARGDMDHNPFDGMKKPNGSTPRERMLSDDEIVKVWTELPTALSRSPACQRIVKLCLVTGQRVGEVSGLETAELDLDDRTWIIPGARTKNGHKHVVPLSDAAIEIIRQALADAGKDAEFVFPNKDGTGPLSPLVVAKTLLRAQERFGLAHWTAHDLRRSAASGMAKLGVPPDCARPHPQPPHHHQGGRHARRLRPIRLRQGEARGVGAVGELAVITNGHGDRQEMQKNAAATDRSNDRFGP